jgi:integrase
MSTVSRLQLRTFVARFELRCAGLSPNCRSRYKSQLQRHVLPALGRIPIDRIDAARVQSHLAELLNAKLAPSTVCSVGRLLLRVLAVAGLEGHQVHRIDGRSLVWPRSQSPPSDPRMFTAQEVERILDAAAGWPRVLYCVLAWSGLRIGEALGLDWQHIDLERSLIRVRQQASRGLLRTLKSRTSRADLPLHSDLQAVLTAYWHSCGSPAAGLIFGGAGGLPRSAQGIASRHLTPLLQKLQIDHAGPHAFRHSFCTRCWAAGLPANVIQRLMRHSNIGMTMRYTHADAEELRAGMNRIPAVAGAAAASVCGVSILSKPTG